jgi:hypothetical protein
MVSKYSRLSNRKQCPNLRLYGNLTRSGRSAVAALSSAGLSRRVGTVEQVSQPAAVHYLQLSNKLPIRRSAIQPGSEARGQDMGEGGRPGHRLGFVGGTGSFGPLGRTQTTEIGIHEQAIFGGRPQALAQIPFEVANAFFCPLYCGKCGGLFNGSTRC